MKTSALLTFSVVFFGVACQDPLPCTDCFEDAEMDDDPIPDLPCGGADLTSDNANCGECGNVCDVAAVGTEWEAGGCFGGECAPLWAGCLPLVESPSRTCAEVCAVFDKNCMANQCAGNTALLFAGVFDQSCWSPLVPFQELGGGCDAELPWEPPGPDLAVSAECCCQ